jgi:proline dehydrogenase
MRVLQGIEKAYSSAMRLAAPAFIQDPLTVDLVINAPALTHQGIAIARDRLRQLLEPFRANSAR